MTVARRGLPLTALLACACASVAVAAAPPKPSPQKQMQVYVDRVEPQAIYALTARSHALGALIELEYGRTLGYSSLRRSGRELLGAHKRLRRIKSPAALAEPHLALIAAWKREGYAIVAYANMLERGAPGAEFAYEFEIAYAREDERHWRTETTVRLRRLGMAVPRWVKRVGTD